jgi:hypothetical protein
MKEPRIKTNYENIKRTNRIATQKRIASIHWRSRSSIRVDRPGVAEHATDPEPGNYGQDNTTKCIYYMRPIQLHRKPHNIILHLVLNNCVPTKQDIPLSHPFQGHES